MTQRDDPLKRRPRTKRQDQIEDEMEARLSRELAHLMRDPRYQGGDPDYRAYIQRQFRRVYDDPSGKPQGLRVGRPKPFVNELEPFHAEREWRLRLGIKDEPASSTESNKPSPGSNKTILGGAGESPQSRRIRKAPLAATTRQNGDGVGSSASEAGFDIIPPSDRALSGLEGNARRHGPDPEDARRAQLERLERDERLHRTEKAIDAMIASWRRDGIATAAEFLQRYREGVGGVHPISWSQLITYPKFRREQERLKDHYLDWVRGTLDDDLWTPFLDLKDGESTRVWTNGGGKRLRLNVNWNPATIGSVFDLNDGKDRDFARAAGQAKIEGIGDLRFTRRGEIIFVSGVVDMKFNEPFNFESGILVWLDSTFGTDAPSISNRDVEEYEKLGPAEEFLSTSRKQWQVTGQIVLRDDGTPDPNETALFWTEADREEAGP